MKDTRYAVGLTYHHFTEVKACRITGRKKSSTMYTTYQLKETGVKIHQEEWTELVLEQIKVNQEEEIFELIFQALKNTNYTKTKDEVLKERALGFYANRFFEKEDTWLRSAIDDILVDRGTTLAQILKGEEPIEEIVENIDNKKEKYGQIEIVSNEFFEVESSVKKEGVNRSAGAMGDKQLCVDVEAVSPYG